LKIVSYFDIRYSDFQTNSSEPGMSKIDKSFKGTVSVVGLGVGPEDLTEAHREAIEAAEVLVGGKRQLPQRWKR
jgi:hypothetical protein